ncbi:MAG: hypothetical protein ACXVCY_18315 [Pseudobdellovibrionaceae bacterium]
MMNCKQIVKTVSSEDKTDWRHRLEVRIHLLMCHHCRTYVKHLEMIKNGFKKIFNTEGQDLDSEKIKELEKKVLKKISPQNKE